MILVDGIGLFSYIFVRFFSVEFYWFFKIIVYFSLLLIKILVDYYKEELERKVFMELLWFVVFILVKNDLDLNRL